MSDDSSDDGAVVRSDDYNVVTSPGTYASVAVGVPTETDSDRSSLEHYA